MALRNRGSFLRWYDTASETSWNRYVEESDCLAGTPLLIPGEFYQFYVNTPDRVPLPNNSATGDNYLKNAYTHATVATNPLTILQYTLDGPLGGAHSYGTIEGPSVADGLYYFQVGDWKSNIVEVCSNSERSILVSFGNKSTIANVYYEYQLDDYRQRFRLRGYVRERQPYIKGSERDESTTGLTRNFKQHLKGFRTIIFENLNDEAHEAAAVMFVHSKLEINGQTVQPKLDGAYKPLTNELETYSDGEFQVWDDAFGVLNVC
jgi:hypothetical protein